MAVPRMLQGMAENGKPFPQMKIVSKRFGTPGVAVVFMAIIILLPVLIADIGSLVTLVIAVPTSWLLGHIVVHIMYWSCADACRTRHVSQDAVLSVAAALRIIGMGQELGPAGLLL